MVDYYGSMVPLNQVPTCPCWTPARSACSPGKAHGRQDREGHRESDLGLNPANMGDLIRVPMPPMTESAAAMTKVVRTRARPPRSPFRNLRRDANDAIKKLVKDKLASEDDKSALRPTSRR